MSNYFYLRIYDGLASKPISCQVLSKEEIEDTIEEFRERLLDEEALKPARGRKGELMAKQRIEKRVIGFSNQLLRDQSEIKKAASALEATKVREPEIYRYEPPVPRQLGPPRMPSRLRVSCMDRLFMLLSDREPRCVEFLRRVGDPMVWEDLVVNQYFHVRERKMAKPIVVKELKREYSIREWMSRKCKSMVESKERKKSEVNQWMRKKRSRLIKKALRWYFELE